jgi:hypothetical protein
MTDDDVEAWSKQVRATGVDPFVTEPLDIEGYFATPDHLNSLNNQCSVKDFQEIFTNVANRPLKLTTGENHRPRGPVFQA